MNISTEFGRWLYAQRVRSDAVGAVASAMARGDCDLTRPHMRAALTKAREEFGGTVRAAHKNRPRVRRTAVTL